MDELKILKLTASILLSMKISGVWYHLIQWTHLNYTASHSRSQWFSLNLGYICKKKVQKLERSKVYRKNITKRHTHISSIISSAHFQLHNSTELNKRKTVFNKFRMIWKVTVAAYFKILTSLKEIRQTKCFNIKKKNYLQESIWSKFHTDNPHICTLRTIIQNLITQYLRFVRLCHISFRCDITPHSSPS